MKHAKQVRAENSAASDVNQGKKINSVETSTGATPGEDQTAKLLEEFESGTSRVENDIVVLLETISDDQLRGLTYLLRGHFTELIDAGRALAGAKTRAAANEPAIAPGDMLAIWAEPDGTGFRPFGPLRPTDDMALGRTHIANLLRHCEELKFQDGIWSLDGLRACLEGNASLEPEREALRAFSDCLNKLMRMREAVRGVSARPATGAEKWLADKLDDEKLTLAGGSDLLHTAVRLLRDSPQSKELADSIDRFDLGGLVLYESRNYNGTL